jgi:glycosyltransferase involved in cell wall biosynthesis
VTTDPLILPLSELTEGLGISSNVLFTGRVHYSDIPLYLAASDVGISYMPLGTPHQYQPPTKLIEYMMASMVAASNRTPAVDEILKDNVNGILFGESTEEIAGGLRRSLELLSPQHREVYLQLTTNAQKAVRDRAWQSIVDEHLIPLYETLCRKQE